MAKELPYFKFIATEWLTGSITSESLEVQGLFINVCALYWKNEGVLSVAEVSHRFKNKKSLNIIFDRYTIVSNGMIVVQYLNEQLSDREFVSKRNSENIKKRWDKKNTTVLPNNTTVSNGNTKLYNKEKEVNNKKNKKEIRTEIEVFESEKSDSSYKIFLEIYSEFYKNKVGTGIKFDGAQGKALKQIISFLVSNSNKKNAEGAAEAFEFILSNWHKLDSFIQDQLKITQINSNLPNILNQLKNGNSKNKNIFESNKQAMHEAAEVLKQKYANE